MISIECARWPEPMKVDASDVLRLDMIARMFPGDCTIRILVNEREAATFDLDYRACDAILGRLRAGWRLKTKSLRWVMEGFPMDVTAQRLAALLGIQGTN